MKQEQMIFFKKIAQHKESGMVSFFETTMLNDYEKMSYLFSITPIVKRTYSEKLRIKDFFLISKIDTDTEFVHFMGKVFDHLRDLRKYRGIDSANLAFNVVTALFYEEIFNLSGVAFRKYLNVDCTPYKFLMQVTDTDSVIRNNLKLLYIRNKDILKVYEEYNLSNNLKLYELCRY